MDTLLALTRALSITSVVVTHDAAVATRADRVVRLLDGRVDSRGVLSPRDSGIRLAASGE